MSKQIVQCAYCGKPKEVFACYIKRSKSNLFFCDNKCSAQYRYRLNEKPKCGVCGLPKHDDNGICKSRFFINTETLDKVGFNTNTIGTPDVFVECDKLKCRLYDLYYIENKSLVEIKEMFCIRNIRSIELLFNLLNIERRDFRESVVNSYDTGRANTSCNKYLRGYHVSWEGLVMFYRSSYELDYMIELDKQRIKYRGENYLKFEYYDTQMKKMRTALPDFYLPETNTIVEIKSCWTYDRQNMIDRVSVYTKNGYSFKLILDHKEVPL